MKCLICQSEMKFTPKKRSVTPFDRYYEVDCPNEDCRFFWGFTSGLNKTIYDYGLEFSVDGSMYLFETTNCLIPEESFTGIDLMIPNPDREGFYRTKDLVTLDHFTPLQDNLEYYVQLVQRLLKIKAFW